MKSPEFIAHGTVSRKDALGIERLGFKAEEGRATVSASLIYAYEWATEDQKRGGSKSKTEREAEETGRILILRTPKDKYVDYATHTDINVDTQNQEVSGFITKYTSGRKQLGIFSESDRVEKRKAIEGVKKEILETKDTLISFLAEQGIRFADLRSREDLMQALEERAVEDQVSILRRVDELESRIQALRVDAEIPLSLDTEDTLMSIVPSPELGAALITLREDIYALKKVDIEAWTEEVSALILTDKDNMIADGVNVEEVVREMLSTSIKTEAVNVIRSLALYVKGAQEFTMKDRSGVKILDKFSYSRDEVRGILETTMTTLTDESFSTGIASVDRYLRLQVRGLLNKIDKKE